MIDINNKYYQQDLETLNQLESIPWEHLNNKSVLLTGATGLIGSCLIDILTYRNKHYNSEITIYIACRNIIKAKNRFKNHFENKYITYIEYNVLKKVTFNFQVDYIIHAASNATPATYASDPVGTLKTSILGVDNLITYAINAKSKRFLYVSSGEVYGEGDGTDFTETNSGYVNSMNPRSCYPSGKRAAETLCASYADQYGVDIVVARPCHIYGPTLSSTDNRAFAQFFKNILAKEDVVLKSSGEQYRSFCYVLDCVSALLIILLKGEKNNAYNIADNNSNVSIAELAKTIAIVGNQQLKFEFPPDYEKKGYSVVTRAILNAKKLEELGWTPQYSLSEGIKRTIQALRSL